MKRLRTAAGGAGAGRVLDAARERAGRAVRLVPAREVAAIALGLAGVALFALAAADSTRETFVFMGFDEDRAALLVAGIAAGLAGAVAGLAGGRRWSASLAGLLALGWLFEATYRQETARATSGTGIGIGQFSMGGWLLTTLALIVSGLLLGLGSGVLGEQLRATVVGVVREARAALQRRGSAEGSPPRPPVRRGLVLVAILAGIALAAPVAGQLLNYGPDSLMLGAGGGGVPLVLNPNADSPGQAATAGPSSSPQSSPQASPSPAGGQVVRLVDGFPWRASHTTGSGTVLAGTLPAPWTGGTASVASYTVYLPPGYATSSRRYPVIYEIPWAISLYDNGASIRPTLDQLMDSGAMPASIVVFLTSDGGPFVDNECIDAAFNREWFDTFVATTLVHAIDSSFRTIASPWARSLMGDSQGGFCAANVLLHHPDVFRQEISFSGYFMAAPLLQMTPSAQAPYAGDVALEQANSPLRNIAALPFTTRHELMFTLVGNPAQAFYGPQLTRFAETARALGAQVRVIDSPYGHSWLSVRAELPAALQAIGLRELANGVFATG